MSDFRRTHSTILTLTLACLLTAASASAAPLLYGVTAGVGPSTLYNISPTTGAATAIGQTGFILVGSLSFAPSGALYGVGVDAGNSEVLLQINPATGAATAVGPLGLAVGHFTVSDIAFRSDGTLFALIALAPFVDLNLYTINTATGAATVVGSLGVGLPSGNGLAFLGNTLYYASSTAASGGRLYTLNQATGAATLATVMTYPATFGPNTSRPAGMKFDPTTGTLFAVVVNGVPLSEAGTGNLWSLGTIDKTTGVVTFIGRTQNQMDGLAVVAGAPTTVPTLSEWAQILMVAVLVVTAIWTLRRRRLTLG
jgi:hypothetical protein